MFPQSLKITKVGEWGTGYFNDVFVQGNYAYCAAFGAGLDIIDISNPLNPVKVGNYDTSGYANGVYVSGNHAYVADGSSGLQVIDISDPTTPALAGSLDTSGSSWEVYLSGNYAYVADYHMGLQVIDITDPTSPTLAGSYDTPGYAMGVYVINSYAFVADGLNGLQIIEITDPASPVLASSLDTSGWVEDVYLSGNYAYVGDSNSGLQVIDITDPTSPALAGSKHTSGYAYGVYISANYAYVADYDSGLLVIDITDPASPTLAGSLDTSGCAHGVYISGDYAYVADYSSGLQVIDISDPTSPAIAGSYNQSGYANGIYISGSYAYTADYERGLQVIDITDQSSPSRIGSCDTPGYGYGVHISNNFAYVADYDKGLQVIDITDPTTPTIAGSRDTTGYAYEVYIKGDYAYVADEEYGFLVINITDPTSPAQIASYDTSGLAFGVYISGNYAYVADGTSGLHVIDITDPASPTLAGSCNTSGHAFGVYISGNYAYVADGTSGLQVIDITNPTSPAIAGSYDTSGYAYGVYISGDYAYVAYGISGLQVIDISDPTTPALAGSYDTYGDARGVYVSGDYAYVVDGTSGKLYIFEVSLEKLTAISSLSPSSGSVGTEVTISGSNFGTTQGTVSFNGVNASVTSWADTEIVSTVPAGASTGPVIVHTSDGKDSNEVTFTVIEVDIPYISSLSPSSGAVGAEVTISGSNFGTTQGTVSFQGVNASITSWSNTEIVTPVPAGASTGSVVVHTSDGKDSNEVTFVVTEGEDEWGTGYYKDVFIQDNYAYCAAYGAGLDIIFISNPSNPVKVGNYDTPGEAYGVYVSGNYAYVADNDKGLHVIDITNPSSPSLAGSCDTSDYAYAVYISTNYAYIAGGGSGLQVIDITDSTSPTLVSSCDTPGIAYGVYVNGNYACVADFDFGLQVIDISDPTSPTLTGSCNTSGRAYAVHVSGNYAYVADWGSGLKVIDISDPTSPTLVGSCDTSGYARGVYINGNHAYVADFDKGLQMIDISDPTSPTLASSYDTPGYAWGVYINSNHAYVADESGGLQVINISNPTSPTLTGSYDTSGWAHGIYVSGNYAYIADWGSGLQVIDISDPTSPSLAGYYDIHGQTRGLNISSNYAYVANYSNGLQVIDISDPTSPTLAGSCDTSGWAYGVYVNGNYAYVADAISGLQVIDITNPSSPTLAGSYNTSGWAYGVYVSGNYAYVADDESGLQVIDITDPTTPILTGSYNTSGWAYGVYVSGNYAYVADYDKGLQVIDITNPTSPTLVGSYDTPGHAHGVYVSGNYAYVADYDKGLHVIDISDPASPDLASSYDTAGWAYGVYVSGNYAYVADGSSGKLYIFEVSLDNLIIISSLSPASGPEGTEVTISGSNFGESQGTVTFNGANASITSWSDTEIITTVPEGASTGSVVVHTSDGKSSNEVTFTVEDIETDNPPSVSITAPQNDSEVSSNVSIQASASDDIGVKNVKFYINGNYLGYDETSPYSYSLDTTQYQNGQHTIKTVATDTAGQTSQHEITVTINNIEDSAPSVLIISPEDEDEVSGKVTIEVSATDDNGINKVNFYIDDGLKGTDTSLPYKYSWDTSGYSKGSHSIKAVAYDTAEQTAEHQISVTLIHGEENTKSDVSGKVNDETTQEPIGGASVKIGSLSSVSTDSNGNYSITDISPGDYTITITKSSYNTLSTSISIPPSSSIVKSFSLYPTTTEVTINSIDSKYSGFVHYLAGIDFEVDYTTQINWGGHPPDKVRFETSNDTYDVSTSANSVKKKFNMGSEFDSSSTLKVKAISSDGTESEEKSADFIVMPPFLSGLSFNLKENWDSFYYEAGFTLNLINEGVGSGVIPETLPFFGDNALNLEYIPEVNATVNSGGQVKINLDWNNKPLVEGEMAGFEYSLNPRLQIYANYMHSSNEYKWSGSAGLYGNASVSKSWPFILMAAPIPIPMYTKASFNLSADATFEVEDINPVTLSGEVGLNPYVRGSLGAGVDCVFSVEGWIGGGADFTLQWPQTPTLKDLTIYLDGGVSVYAYLWEWEEDLLKWDWNVYETSTNAIEGKIVPLARPKLMSRDYLYERGQFKRPARFSLRTVDHSGKTYTVAKAALQSSSFPYSEAILSSDGNHVSLTWLKDNEQRTSMNRTIAVFSSFDGSSWSDPLAVADDGTADFHPQTITFSDGTVYAAWENEKTEMADTATLEDMTKNLEISASVYDPSTEAWESSLNLTNNNYIDRSPRLSGKSKNNVMLVWISNESNNLRGSAENPNKILYSIFSGATWSAPQLASEIPFGILKYDLVYDGNRGHVILSLDTDEDQETITDHELYLLTYDNGAWGDLERLTEDDTIDDNPQTALDPNGNFILTWIKGEELSSAIDFDMTTRTTIMSDEYSTNLADFKLASSLDGNLALVWAEASSYSSDIYAVFYNPTYNVWGSPKQLTFDKETERNITASFYGSDTIISVYNRNEMGEAQITRKAANGKVITLDQPVIISSDLYMLKYTMGKDLALESDSLASSPENPEPGIDITLSVKAVNLGDEPATEVPVAFYLGDPSSGGTKIGEVTLSDVFKPGETTEASIVWTVPDTTTPLDIYAVIDPDATFDPINRSNNVVNTQLAKPDLLVKNVNWIMPSDKLISLTTRITNEGVIPSGATTVKFRKDSTEGGLLSEQDISSLNKYESADVNLTWDVSGISSKVYTVCIVVDEGNAVAESDEENNTQEVIIEKSAAISISSSALNFGATTGYKTSNQQIIISNAGRGTLDWSISDDADWLSVTPTSGTGNALITVSVEPTGLSAGIYTATINISSSTALNSPRTIDVTLIVQSSSGSIQPFGLVDTPIDGTTGVAGAIPVSGWALDDIEVTKVEIWREPVEDEPTAENGLVFIGDATLVEGARSDIEQEYPDYPFSYRAAWGYMLLTNYLPNQGNNTYTIYAIAYDKEGNITELGTTTITCDNTSATQPFGTIDTPTQGGEASGDDYLNFGWALTPQPNSILVDGSTITVYIDGEEAGNPMYGQYREDVSLLFPGYANSDGAVGYFYIDTTAYESGVHTIAWGVEDSAGNTAGIGTRYFTIFNTEATGLLQTGMKIRRVNLDSPYSFEFVNGLLTSFEPAKVRKGYKGGSEPEIAMTERYGTTTIEIREVERVAVEFGKITDLKGYLVVGEELRPLPIGSTLNKKKGTFSWQPGPGFLGEYNLVFLVQDETKLMRKIKIRVKIEPKFYIY